MPNRFHKFPHTPHLLWLGAGVPREDKLLAPIEAQAFLKNPVIVEEKVDGANLGLSVGPDGRIRAQNRGNYLAPGQGQPQWNPLWAWIAQRADSLAEKLGPDLMLFGEWTYALHSIAYSDLPDWLLAFDVYDLKSKRFWSVDRRNAFAKDLGIQTVPEIFRGHIALDQASDLIGNSRLGAPRMEGLYLRSESDGHLQQRAKVVRAEFKQQIEEHWTRRALIKNRLRPAPAQPGLHPHPPTAPSPAR